MTAISTELMSPDLVYNMIGVNAGADQRLLDETLETAAENKAALLQAKTTIGEQAEELSSLKATLTQVKAEKNDAIAALNAQLQSKVASLQQIINTQSNEIAYQKRCVANVTAELTQLQSRLDLVRNVLTKMGWQVNF